MKQLLKILALNTLGWRTKRKIVILESDDWGSVRTPSIKSLEALHKRNVNIKQCTYMMYDSIAQHEDLAFLFEVLSKAKGFYNHACLTANCLVANPDFAAIAASDYSHYSYQLLPKTLEQYSNRNSLLDMWFEGKNKNVFFMQSHGREHVNTTRWLKALQSGDEITRLAFDYGMFGVSGHVISQRRESFLSAFDGANDASSSIIADGLNIFEKLFGYRSASFIAPNYVWGHEVEEASAREGVQFIQGGFIQFFPSLEAEKKQTKRRFLGHRNPYKQYALVRNVHFEPSSNPNIDWVDKSLAEVKAAFALRKPAIISTHRVNYIGRLDTRNRDQNLKLLNTLLSNIIKKWPSVEFMTSPQLGQLMASK
ncbi:hypothetical protein [Phaeodactylibacter xiamenensis]|uniref:hypothetical protein n=1 Tax=Phaeodactylibacter xiamenensis TaxID=1524460 RepID=UPI003BA9C221